MKKILILALLVITSASFNTLSAQNKKKNKKKQATEEVVASPTVVKLQTASDSLSYAAGMAMTRGLDTYLANQFGIKLAQMPDFIRGLRKGIENRKDSAFAAFVAGLTISEQVDKQMLSNIVSQFEGSSSPINADLLYKGFLAAMEKDTTLFKTETASDLFEAKQQALKAQKEAEHKAKNEQYLSENKKKADVITLPDGLQYRIITKGTGPLPKENDRVQVVYEGKTIDGKVFDATANHGKEFDTFGVSGLIRGWTEALLMMPVGSKWELVIPQELAYGARGAGRDIAPYSTLVFTLELKGIEPAAAPATQTEAKKAPEKKVEAKKSAAKTTKRTVKK